MHVRFRREGVSVHAVDDLLALRVSLSPLAKLQQMFRLDLEQAALHPAIETDALQQQVVVRIVRQAPDPELPEPLDRVLNVSGGSDARSSGC